MCVATSAVLSGWSIGEDDGDEEEEEDGHGTRRFEK
uniref:Uncharacterized protein n=1 Tax=Peronospora matthiolae TaxID=2874970 RepID=A0AAV1UVM3_9STRA